MEEGLFVVGESVEGIEDGEVFCFVSVEGWGKNDAVGNAAGEDFAGEGVALDSAGGGSGREGKEIEEEEEEEVEEGDLWPAARDRKSQPSRSKQATIPPLRLSNDASLRDG